MPKEKKSSSEKIIEQINESKNITIRHVLQNDDPDYEKVTYKIDPTAMNGSFMYFDPDNFDQPLVREMTKAKSDDTIFSLIRSNQNKYEKYIGKPLIYVVLRGNRFRGKNTVELTLYKRTITDKFELSSADDNDHNTWGNTIKFNTEFLETYGFKWSDIRRCYEALEKNTELYDKLIKVTIEEVYETIKRKPKKVDTPLVIPKTLMTKKELENRLLLRDMEELSEFITQKCVRVLYD